MTQKQTDMIQMISVFAGGKELYGAEKLSWSENLKKSQYVASLSNVEGSISFSGDNHDVLKSLQKEEKQFDMFVEIKFVSGLVKWTYLQNVSFHKIHSLSSLEEGPNQRYVTYSFFADAGEDMNPPFSRVDILKAALEASEENDKGLLSLACKTYLQNQMKKDTFSIETYITEQTEQTEEEEALAWASSIADSFLAEIGFSEEEMHKFLEETKKDEA